MSDTSSIKDLVLARKEEEEVQLQGSEVTAAPATLTISTAGADGPVRKVECSRFISSLNLEDCKAGRFVNSPPPPIDWTFENSFQQGTVGLLVGAGGIGKSFIVGEVGASVAMGLPLFGDNLKPCRPGKVLAFFCEENEHMLHVRTHSMYHHIFNNDGLGLGLLVNDEHSRRFKENYYPVAVSGYDMRLVTKTSSEELIPTQVYKEILAKCQTVRSLSLIIIDTYSRTSGFDENNNPAATYYCSLAEQLATATGASILLVHHTGKGSFNSKDYRVALQQDSLRGASALTGGVRFQLNGSCISGAKAQQMFNIDYTPVNGEFIALQVSKKNYGPPEKEFYMRRGEGGFLSHYIPEPDTREDDAKASLVEKLVQHVKGTESSGEKLLTMTDLKRDVARLWKKEEGVANATQKGIEEAALTAIEDGRLFLVTRSIDGKSGRTAQYLATKPD